MASFDDDDEVTPAPLYLGEEKDLSDPRTREWANRELYYVGRIARLQAEVGRLQIEAGRLRAAKAQLSLEINRLRKKGRDP